MTQGTTSAASVENSKACRADLGHAHEVGDDTVDVGAAVGQGLLVAVLVVRLQRLVHGLELQGRLLLDQLQAPKPPSVGMNVCWLPAGGCSMCRDPA